MTENTTNRAVENAAVSWVLAFERTTGRSPTDVRGAGSAGDISSPPRTIEVKAYGGSARGSELWVEVRQYEAALNDPEFYVYVVENVRQGDPSNFRLLVLGRDRLHRLLARAKEQRYYTVPWPVADYDADPPVQVAPLTGTDGASTKTWAGHRFEAAGALDALRDESGLVIERMPQGAYANSGGLRLNRHGAGPFCELTPPALPPRPGVYVVTCDDEPMYVGIAENLRERWGPRGYARIHPRNCYEGGQSTNCKVNNRILSALRDGQRVALWSLVTADGPLVEGALISELRPPWNGRV